MNQDFQLQLQAYLDGELTEREIRSIETRLQQDPAARDLLVELRQTRSLLSGQELDRSVPESREFYWSKIARQIERESVQREPRPARGDGWDRWLRKAFSPVGGLSALAVLALCGVLWFSDSNEDMALRDLKMNPHETQMLTYHDQEEKMTVVWLSYNE